MGYFWTMFGLYVLSGVAIVALLLTDNCPSWMLVAFHVVAAAAAIVVGLVVTERDEDK